MVWLFIIFVVLNIGLFLYWQLIITEGTYLGSRVVTLLYDWTAENYNGIKAFDDDFEDWAIGKPMMHRLYAQPTALVLDVATGTGRVPHTLLRQIGYHGQIVGLDRATRMLAVAQRDTADQADRVLLIQADALALPFADNTFPMVSCLEALEFLPTPQAGLQELVRVLAPANDDYPDQGWLVTTNRIGWESWLMPGKTWSTKQLETILNQLPLRYIDIRPWETIYNIVWAQKVE